MDPEKVHYELDKFKLAELQTFRNILMTLDLAGLSIHDALKYIAWRTMPSEIAYYKACPNCNTRMELYPVNSNPRDQIGGKWKSQWYCPECGESHFQKGTVVKILAKTRKQNVGEREKFIKKKEGLELEVAKFINATQLTSVCPECKEEMALWPIRTEKGKANVHGYKIVWFCNNCGYERYSKNTVIEEAKLIEAI